MTTPRTSVVIPCFNGQDYLPQALASVRGQTRPPLEVVVVDDGSAVPITLPAGWDGPPVRLVRTPNRGLASARNEGLARAAGEFVAYLDCDDWWHPDKLLRQEAALDADPAAVGCYTRCAEGDGLFGFGPYPPPGVGRDDFVAVLWHHTFFPPSSLLARRAVVDAVGRFDPTFPIGEDVDQYLRLLTVGALVEVPEPLTFYRVHPGQMSGDPRKRLTGWAVARRGMIARHCDLLVRSGIRPDALGHAHRNHVLLTFYRRQFRAARPLLWAYWREHPRDWRVLVRLLVACLPAGLVARARGSVTTAPNPNRADPDGWDRAVRELAPVLSRPVTP